MAGLVSFVGAGPGAADLITVRGARRIAEADIVVWSATVVHPECIREHASPDAELVDSSRVSQEYQLEVYRRAAVKRLRVVRIHAGDTSLWGALQEQYDAAQRIGLEVEIVPGVSAFSAAAAAAGRELTGPEVAQSVVLTRLEGGKTPLPPGAKVRDLAQHGATMAVQLPAARIAALTEELRAGGYPEETPVVVAYKTSWPDELMLHTTLAELEATVKKHKLWRHALFLVGESLRASSPRSRAYQAGAASAYRRSEVEPRRTPRTERRVSAPAAEVIETGAPAAIRPSGQPGAEAAWWAVRDWQESARATGRTSAKYRATRTTTLAATAGKRPTAAASTRRGQVTLALEDKPEPAAKPKARPAAKPAKAVAEPVVASPVELVAPESVSAEPSQSTVDSDLSTVDNAAEAPAPAQSQPAPPKAAAAKSKAKSTAPRRGKRTARNS